MSKRAYWNIFVWKVAGAKSDMSKGTELALHKSIKKKESIF
jgi:hypothetical protein